MTGKSSVGTAILGLNVRVTMHSGAVFNGLIFAWEPSMSLLALQAAPAASASSASTSTTSQRPSNQPRSPAATPSQKQHPGAPDFHLLKLHSIKEVLNVADNSVIVLGNIRDPGQVKDAKGGLASALMPVGIAPLDKLAAREQAAVRAESERHAKIGVGVTAEAQALFYALNKTLPLRWKGDKIVVLDEVTIASPYTVDDVRGVSASSSAATIARVKTVLESERKRLNTPDSAANKS